ncbi:MAG: hypothetical protein EOQ98_21260 [Mesorhizobium sp.]|nr:hypothetical protein EOD08_33280 [Mesorhizobium sp. M6A.T.Ca.TU.002.02.2.1]RWO96890.1 MAG: hypothetical protein EOQ98_21260 [Mesorhizobium sp.]TIM37438.1 MAG: hypothetical protein E5Y69_15595 [Mesorhizobium sp.]
MMPACERRFPVLPVLTYPKVRSAPVLGNHHSRRGLTRISTYLGRGFFSMAVQSHGPCLARRGPACF